MTTKRCQLYAHVVNETRAVRCLNTGTHWTERFDIEPLLTCSVWVCAGPCEFDEDVTEVRSVFVSQAEEAA